MLTAVGCEQVQVTTNKCERLLSLATQRNSKLHNAVVRPHLSFYMLVHPRILHFTRARGKISRMQKKQKTDNRYHVEYCCEKSGLQSTAIFRKSPAAVYFPHSAHPNNFALGLDPDWEAQCRGIHPSEAQTIAHRNLSPYLALG